jgi:ADP-heptose:LPS heptosyltransferase
VVRVSGASITITASAVGKYMNSWEEQLALGWYSKILATGDEPCFEFLRNRRFFQQLTTSAGNVKNLHHLTFTNLIRENRILIAPGASTPERRWPAEKFAQLLDVLAEKFPGSRFFLTGSPDEAILCSEIAASCRIAVPEISAGKLSLSETMNLMATSALLIANESGPVHMAATTDTACVCISNGNHFGRWNPYPRDVAPNILTCYPEDFYPLERNGGHLMEKYHEHSPLKAALVSFDRVLQACLNLLSKDKNPM